MMVREEHADLLPSLALRDRECVQIGSARPPPREGHLTRPRITDTLGAPDKTHLDALRPIGQDHGYRSLAWLRLKGVAVVADVPERAANFIDREHRS